MIKSLLMAVVMGTAAFGNMALAEHNEPNYPYYPSQTAYRLASLAEELAGGRYFDGPSLREHGPGPGPRRSVRFAADELHHAASDLYYLLRNQGRFTDVEIRSLNDVAPVSSSTSENKDHRDDQARYAFDRVTDAYNQLYYATNGYGEYYYQMRRIWDTYSQLRWQLFGN
jgi:hypothetical protein